MALMIKEHGGSVRTYDGAMLSLNRAESIFFNDTGFAMTCPDIDMGVFLRDSSVWAERDLRHHTREYSV